ncbi:MAG: hypothetical protein WEC75_11970 [Dehalococcoidia bacterium]
MDDVTSVDQLLSRAAAGLAYPSTPQLRARVLAAIAGDAGPASPRRVTPAPAAGRYRFAVAAGAAAAVALGVALGVPASRSAIADFFGVEGSRVERLPTRPAGVTPTPFPPATELPPDARAVSLDAAGEALGFAPALPVGYGDPREVYLVAYGEQDVAILRYERFDLWEGKLEHQIIFSKGAPQSVVFLELTVGGRPAYWIEGGEHLVSVVDAAGQEIPGSGRTVARNTLVLSSESAFYRIETDFSRLEAVAIAETLP